MGSIPVPAHGRAVCFGLTPNSRNSALKTDGGHKGSVATISWFHSEDAALEGCVRQVLSSGACPGRASIEAGPAAYVKFARPDVDGFGRAVNNNSRLGS